MNSKVYIVGAGPGDMQLLTLKAYRLIKLADVLMYDYLLPNEITKLAKKDCTLIAHIKNSTSTERLEDFKRSVLEHYGKKKVIVRLHIGDPMLFGMGHEETSFLKEQGMSYEVVPGITSALGVPTSIGLPVTARGTSSAVVIFNGHPINEKEINWDSLAKIDGTLIALMGISGIDKIVNNLISSGLDPLTPSCIISNGTLKGQKVAYGNLRELVSLVLREKLAAPAVIVIGKVAKPASV